MLFNMGFKAYKILDQEKIHVEQSGPRSIMSNSRREKYIDPVILSSLIDICNKPRKRAKRIRGMRSNLTKQDKPHSEHYVNKKIITT